MKTIAVIPARSGSKGLPDKNIIELNGKPLIYYTIQAALDSGCFDEIMVSTDSEKYAEIAIKYGANVPFLRSEALSSDTAGSWDTVREVLDNYKKAGKEYDYVALLQPTSPLRDKDDIIGVFDKLKQAGTNNVVTVTEVEHPVQWCFTMPNDGNLEELASSPYNYMRRQDLEMYYRENGAVYLVDAVRITDSNYNFYADRCVGYVMARDKSVDIDTKVDLEIARILMANRGGV